MRETQFAHALDSAMVRAQLYQQQGQQARFATAVGAYQRQALTGLNGDVGVMQ
jgi:hypothetical protein